MTNQEMLRLLCMVSLNPHEADKWRTDLDRALRQEFGIHSGDWRNDCRELLKKCLEVAVVKS